MSTTREPETRTERREPRRHPALDFRFRDPSGDTRAAVDWVVFGVTAVIAIGFLLWGFLSTASLNDTSTSALSWTMKSLD